MAGTGKERAKDTAESELWARVFKRMVLWTIKVHRVKPADAEEIVQQAAEQLIQAGTLSLTDQKELMVALGSRINGIAVNRRRNKADRAVALTSDGAAAEPEQPDAADRLGEVDFAKRAVSTLLDRLGGDDVAERIVMLIVDGVEDPAEQAKALGCDVRDVYNARRRLKVHKEAVQKLMEARDGH